MLNKVQAYIAKHQLLQRDGRYLVALSGGADSVALLLLMQELGYIVEAAHCNFHLRGEESDSDEQFVIQLCESRGVALHRAHFDTREYARLHHVSIEMAARELRYHYFEQLCNDLSFDGICVAHHRDDSVETVLMNLIRGTGLRGLLGIRPRNGHILRPLLCVSRQEIEDFLHASRQPFVTDSSNLVDDVVRNKLRLNVLPQLLDINPAASEHIQQTVEYVSEALGLYEEAVSRRCQEAVVEQSADRLVLDVSKLDVESLLFEVLKNYGFNSEQVAQIHQCTSTGRLFSSAEYDLVCDRGHLIIERRQEQVKPLVIPETGTYVLSDDSRLSVESFKRPSVFEPSKAPGHVHLDASKIHFPLLVRPTAVGDSFVPFGMSGHKLVSDFLTDRKVNLLDKRKSLVVCDATGDILWVIGYQTDNRFRVSKETEQILQIKL